MALDAAIVRLSDGERLRDPLRQRHLEFLTTDLPGRLAPGQCVLITDSMEEFRKFQFFVTCLAVSPDAGQFRAAGARAVYRDVDDLTARLDEALHLASPGSAHLTRELMNGLMRQALAIARDGMNAGEAPIGCLLARGDGSVIASGYNEQNRTQNKTAHAEIVTFARAAGKTPLDARDLIMVSTLEPCVMCTGAAMEAAVDTIVYSLPAPADSGTRRVACPLSPESQMPRIIGPILTNESRSLFEEWLKKDLPPQQRKFGEQLLKLT